MKNIPDSTTHKYKLLLFVSGMSVKSVNAIKNLNIICDTYLKSNAEVQIIDISRNKELAITHQIIAIPTLIIENAYQKRIILGDLSDTAKVLKALDINHTD